MPTPKPKSDNLPILAFPTPARWDAWLHQHHTTSPGLWLRLYKKATGIESITYPQALDVALCYGWIDGQKRTHDAASWLQKFTPRRPKSLWSKKNTQHIARLTKAGKMHPAGHAAVDAAKKDGRWNRAYESAATATPPPDFLAALDKNKKAQAFFATLNKTNIYGILWRIQTAKKPETRQKRIQEFVAMLSRGEKLH